MQQHYTKPLSHIKNKLLHFEILSRYYTVPTSSSPPYFDTLCCAFTKKNLLEPALHTVYVLHSGNGNMLYK